MSDAESDGTSDKGAVEVEATDGLQRKEYSVMLKVREVTFDGCKKPRWKIHPSEINLRRAEKATWQFQGYGADRLQRSM